MKKFRTITLGVALTAALSMGAVGAQASTMSMNMDTGNAIGTGSPIGTLGTGTTTTTGTTTRSGYTGSNYDATSPGMGLGTGVSSQNFSGNGTTGVYPTNRTTPNTYSGYGTTTRGTGVMDHINGYGTTNMTDRMSVKSIATTPPSNYRAYSTTTSNGMNWGWLGLVGLLGLAGLRSSNKRRDESYK
jgi:MYXO-CTERM domain-containing protein